MEYGTARVPMLDEDGKLPDEYTPQGAYDAVAAAEAARDAAILAAGSSQFAGAVIAAGVDLDTLTTPGIYRQHTAPNATLALHYPISGYVGVLEVTHSTIGSTIQQRYTVGTGTTAGKGFWIRRHSTSWSEWRFIPTQRVDQTAGRAIYTWDDVNNREQLIYGDTGDRNMNSEMKNGWAIASTGGSLYVRRVGNHVTISFQGLDSSAATGVVILDLPSGFRPAGNRWRYRLIERSLTGSNSDRFAATGTDFRIAALAVGQFSTYAYSDLSYPTTDPWPASLPGIASGSIPNA